MARAAFHNLGCKVNEYETEAMKQQLLRAGYEIVEFDQPADVYVVNTCTVTQIADRKSRQYLHKARQLSPEAVVVAAGCYVQEAKERLLNEESVDIVLGNNEKGRLAEVLEGFRREAASERDFAPDINKERVYETLFLEEPVGRTRAFVKIQDGCNQFCTYCKIPYVRGRVRSRDEEDILREVKSLVAHGVKEIVLTGIHVSSYGLDRTAEGAAGARTAEASEQKTNRDLLALIGSLNDLTGLERIRLGSLEPGIVTEDFARELAAYKKVCAQFHLSMQSGCDATLKRMNRRYTTADFMESVRRLRANFDRPAITTDIIAGFPGETDEEFAESLSFTESVAFARTHIFKYSRREKTVAFSLPGQVPERVKTARSGELIELDKKMRKVYINSIRTKALEVLFEEKEEKAGMTYWKGHTREDLTAIMASEDDLENQIVTCRYLRTASDGAVLVARV